MLSIIYRTAADMLADRGFSITASYSNTDELLEAVDKCKPVLVGTSSSQTSYVYIDKEERTGIKTARTLTENHSEALIVVVSMEGPTPFCRREVGDSLNFNFFLAKELIYNVTRHILVPPHRKMSEIEAKQMMDRYSALPEQLPVLLMHDPIRRYYNWAPGSIIEIKRAGMTQEQCNYYRKVSGRVMVAAEH